MTDILLKPIPTIPSMGRSLIAHDPKSRDYPARGVLMEAGVKRVTRTWRRGTPAYDQGNTSSCVGQTFKGVLNTAPHLALVAAGIRTRYDAYDFYRGGQRNDEWPGEEPRYYGTSALGVCKYLKYQDKIQEFRWCFGLDDTLDTLSQHGPVGIGVYWFERMMSTNSQGFIVPGGRNIGGHEVELLGINVAEEYVVGQNSWGTRWGVNGRFKMTWTSLDWLLQQQGDAVTVVR